MPAEHPLIKPAENPTILIVGAGLAGLTLAILLEKAGVPYQLYDRMTQIKPLGAAISLGVNVAPLFKQIGIYDEFTTLGKPSFSLDHYNEARKLEFSLDGKEMPKLGGCNTYISSRPVLYDLMLRQIPSEKVHLGKRMLSMKQNEHGVRVEFADKSVAEGDILVGADGAYSGVRQKMFEQLKKEGKLPASDDCALPFSSIMLVGQTNPMDPVKYPELADPFCHFIKVLGKDKPYSWNSLSVKDNIYCWGVVQYLDKETSKDNDTFRNSEWGPETTRAMCEEVRDFPLPGGDGNRTMGDLIDNTPFVSKVMLEEKVFDTWYSGRTVLIGDACHKIHPSAGAGAVNAMQDAVALANWISILETTTIEEAETIFKEYHAERHPVAVISYENGQTLARTTAKDWKASITRFISKNMPSWLWRIMLQRMAASRPQVSFLPLVKDEGTVPPKYQPSLEKTLAIRQAREKAAAVVV